MVLVKEAIKYLKSVFFGDLGETTHVNSSMDKFPTISVVKKALESVIGKRLSLDTTDETQTEMTVFKSGNTSSLFKLASGEAASFRLNLVARQTDGTGVGSVLSFQATGAIKNIGGTTAIVDAVDSGYIRDSGASAWAVDIAADNTNDCLSVKVTGEASKDISWSGYLEYVLV